MTVNAFLTWFSHYWWLLFIFGGVIGSLLEGVRDFVLAALETIFGNRHAQVTPPATHAPIQTAPGTAPVAGKKPGPCVHRRVTRIMSVDDELVGWLCTNCDTRLPADWAVREEDL